MKAIFTLCALATVALAGDSHHYTTLTTTYVTKSVCPVVTTKYEHGTTAVITKLTTSTITLTGLITVTVPGQPTTKIVESEAYTTYTTVCPVTETKTLEGSTIIEVYSSTSTVTELVKSTIEAYTTLAPITKSIITEVEVTSTSLCPVTEIKTVAGQEVTIVYTSTSLVVVKAPTTMYEYTTAFTTLYETAEVYTTESYFETFYTTVRAGSTIVITESLTKTFHITSIYTLTSTLEPPTTKATVFIPITLATSIPTLEVITVPSDVTETTQGGTIYSNILAPTTSTVSFPPSTTTVPPSSSTAAPIQVSGNAAATNAPMAYAVVGAMAFLALA